MTSIKKILNEELNKIICESEWNFHHTSKDIKGYGKPYQSDSRYMMIGRDTGHFGSGTYFSTYNSIYDRNDDIHKYGEDYDDNPEFIKVGNNVYRTDFDIYKNLYRVENEKEGDILYTTLKTLNAMFNIVSDKKYNLSAKYQLVSNNCKYLGLKCPDYKKLIRMMQEYSSSDNIQSFSTYFMEYNGYNGVNVSGIPKYDNTTHGSVIYDLSKKSLVPVKTDKNIKGSFNSNGDTVARESEWDKDAYTSSLVGDENFPIYKLKDYDIKTQKRLIKNFVMSNRLLDKDEIEMLDKNVIEFYMKLIYNMKPRFGRSSFDYYIHEYKIIDIIRDYKLYYWINYIPNDDEYKNNTILIKLIKSAWLNDDFPFDDDEEHDYMVRYIENLLEYMKRKPTEEEKLLINKYL